MACYRSFGAIRPEFEDFFDVVDKVRADLSSQGTQRGRQDLVTRRRAIGRTLSDVARDLDVLPLTIVQRAMKSAGLSFGLSRNWQTNFVSGAVRWDLLCAYYYYLHAHPKLQRIAAEVDQAWFKTSFIAMAGWSVRLLAQEPDAPNMQVWGIVPTGHRIAADRELFLVSLTDYGQRVVVGTPVECFLEVSARRGRIGAISFGFHQVDVNIEYDRQTDSSFCFSRVEIEFAEGVVLKPAGVGLDKRWEVAATSGLIEGDWHTSEPILTLSPKEIPYEFQVQAVAGKASIVVRDADDAPILDGNVEAILAAIAVRYVGLKPEDDVDVGPRHIMMYRQYLELRQIDRKL